MALAKRKTAKTSRTAATVRVACVQLQARALGGFTEFAAQVAFFVSTAADYGCDFVLFPEYFSMPLLAKAGVGDARAAARALAKFTPQFEELMGGLARQQNLHIIAGSHPAHTGRRLHNVSALFRPDGVPFVHRKLHITPHEREHHGIAGGGALEVFTTPKAKVGILVCYDVEFPEAARHLAERGAEIIFVPYCTDNRQGHLRVSYCAQARAVENQLYVATAGLVGNLAGVPGMDLHYAQSAIYTPCDFGFPRDAILARADANIETMLVADLDLAALHHTRAEGTVRPWHDRRKDLFPFRHRFENLPNPPISLAGK